MVLKMTVVLSVFWVLPIKPTYDIVKYTDNTFLHTLTSSAGVLGSEKLLYQYLNVVNKMIHTGVGTIRGSKCLILF